MVSPKLRDLLYFDFEKASSIWSQLQWGHQEKLTITSDESKNKNYGASLGIPEIVKGEFNIGTAENRTIIETRILHHDLLNRIESILSSYNLIHYSNDALPDNISSPKEIRDAIGQSPYIIATGWSVFEDYSHLLAITEKFNDIIEFIGYSIAKNDPNFEALSKELQAKKSEVNPDEKDKNKNAVLNRAIKELEYKIRKIAKSQIEGIEDWVQDGIKLWIETFYPSRINFRVYPFNECPSFQILCNLKKDSFVDQNLGHLLYGYGSHPNIPLSIFGLITSIPPEDTNFFDPLSEFTEEKNLTNEESIEHAMRNMFEAMKSLDKFSNYSRFPNITVHPIAVFREFELPQEDNKT